MNRYYAVYGTNGLGVYDNYYKVEQSRPYIKKFRTKRFDTLEEAAEYAETGHLILTNKDVVMPVIRLNWLVRTKQFLE